MPDGKQGRALPGPARGEPPLDRPRLRDAFQGRSLWRSLRRSLDLALLPLSACSTVLSPAAFDGAQPEFRPETVFAGATTSSGVLEDASGAPTRRLHVAGTGEVLPDGTLRLAQAITFDDDSPTRRTWLLHRLDAHHYAGTLTDASGPVRAEAYGSLFHLRYPMRHPFAATMEQWLYLQPDGRTVVNEATVRVLGLVVAHLSERITRETP